MLGIFLSFLITTSEGGYPLSDKIQAFLYGRLQNLKLLEKGYIILPVDIIRSTEEYIVVKDEDSYPDESTIKINPGTKIVLINFKTLETLIGEKPSLIDIENFALNFNFESDINKLSSGFKNVFITLSAPEKGTAFLICKTGKGMNLSEYIKEIKEIYIFKNE
ncbi:MAG: hypothetical protein ABIM85_06235 [candidate division WOR-3 bacterium]